LKLVRFAHTPHGTFGKLVVGDREYFTVEGRWHDNAPFLSCIPCGIYPATVMKHDRLGYAVRIDDVPDRNAIYMHIANVSSEVEGCIGVGRSLGMLGQRWAVMDSASAMRELYRILEGFATVTLHVAVDIPTMAQRPQGANNKG
jgi:hypothetical protein